MSNPIRSVGEVEYDINKMFDDVKCFLTCNTTISSVMRTSSSVEIFHIYTRKRRDFHEGREQPQVLTVWMAHEYDRRLDEPKTELTFTGKWHDNEVKYLSEAQTSIKKLSEEYVIALKNAKLIKLLSN